jgi:hypothetical protein
MLPREVFGLLKAVHLVQRIPFILSIIADLPTVKIRIRE